MPCAIADLPGAWRKMVGERGFATNYLRARQVTESRQNSEPLTPPVHNLGHNLGHNSSGLLGQPAQVTSASMVALRPSRPFGGNVRD